MIVCSHNLSETGSFQRCQNTVSWHMKDGKRVYEKYCREHAPLHQLQAFVRYVDGYGGETREASEEEVLKLMRSDKYFVPSFRSYVSHEYFKLMVNHATTYFFVYFKTLKDMLRWIKGNIKPNQTIVWFGAKVEVSNILEEEL